MDDIKLVMDKHRAQIIGLLNSRGVKTFEGRSLESITYSKLIEQLEKSYQQGRVVNYDRRCALYSLPPL